MSSVAVLTNSVGQSDDPADLDVRVQAEHIVASLRQRGHTTWTLEVTLDLEDLVSELRARDPVLVFNLVESLHGHDELMHLVPAVLAAEGFRFTGCRAWAVMTTTDKHRAKRELVRSHVRTPNWQLASDVVARGLEVAAPAILKPRCADASQGITDASVAATGAAVLAAVNALSRHQRRATIVERFIEGREFCVSLLGSGPEPDVLPVSELLFDHYPAGKPAIIGYNAKWAPDSFEYTHTPRSFDRHPDDGDLHDRLIRAARKCWHVFGLTGYARVDFRVDRSGTPWVVDVNANPCLSPDAGMAAAACRAGLGYADLIERIARAAE